MEGMLGACRTFAALPGRRFDEAPLYRAACACQQTGEGERGRPR